MNSPSDEAADTLSREQYRTLALAACTQCALLVHELATTGNADAQAMKTCLLPLLVLDPDSNSEVYPRPAGFSRGLEVLQQMYSNSGPGQYAPLIRYLSGLLILQKTLASRPEIQQQIRDGLQQFDPQLLNEQGFQEHDHERLSAIYQRTISTLRYRIHVAGNPEHLRKKEIADQIRSLLFAGIRSAMLWQQLGGRRWHLLLQRKQIRNSISAIRRALITIH